jgi:hypothetical protein
VSVPNKFKVQATGAWPPPYVAPAGTKVVGANQLPAGCDSWAQPCWHDAVANGAFKFVATPETATGVHSRPIVFAHCRNTSTMFGIVDLWSVHVTYAEDGTALGFDIGGGTGAITVVRGSDEGAVYGNRASGGCVHWYWISPTNRATKPATCSP